MAAGQTNLVNTFQVIKNIVQDCKASHIFSVLAIISFLICIYAVYKGLQLEKLACKADPYQYKTYAEQANNYWKIFLGSLFATYVSTGCTQFLSFRD